MGARFSATSLILFRAAAWLALLAVSMLEPLEGQQTLRIHGAADDSASVVVAEILARDDYTLLERDTVLGPESRIRGDLVVVKATVRLAGSVDGSVAVLGGELFIRPGAVVNGDIAVVGGAAYPSRLATTGRTLTVPADVMVDVVPESGGYAIGLTGPPPPRRLRPTGVLGLALPRYDRVDGLTAAYGSRLLLGDDPDGSFLRGAVAYHTERGTFGGAAAVELRLGRTAWAVAEVARATLTNETWIRGSVANSLAAVSLGSDARNYHESDYATVRVERRPIQPLVQGESFLAPRLELRLSRDRSLSAGDPWKLLGDEWRENPAISDGTLASVIAGAGLAWHGITSSFTGDAAVEWAPASVGDFEFVQIVSEGLWTMRALWTHRIDLRARAAIPLGPDAAPGQRWSFVGGPGTLPTLDYGARRGDHLIFIRGDYSVPVAMVALPVVGVPTLRFSQATGSAWVTGAEKPRWDQNLGVGVAFRVLEAVVWVDPASEPLSPVVAIGLSLPL